MSSSSKVPFYGRRYTPRTTTGCLTCRQRRLKCDEAKPACGRCTRADLECIYGVQLKWPTKGAKLGNNRIRQDRRKSGSSFTKDASSGTAQPTVVIVTPPPALSDGVSTLADNGLNRGLRELDDTCLWSLDNRSASSVHQYQSDADGHFLDTRPSSDLHDSDNLELHLSEQSSLSLRVMDYPLPSMDNEDRMLFDFYARNMCPKCTVRNGNNNNYRQVVLPLAYESRLLLKTVLAVAANRLRIHNRYFEAVALRYQTLALNGLQQSIATEQRTWFSRIEILSIILMLCFFEIYSPGPGSTDQNGVPIRPWRTHLQGVFYLLKEGTIAESQDSHYEQGILSFLSQYFASRSTLTYTAMSHHEDQDSMLQSASYWLMRVDRPPGEINPFVGCSNELLKLILSTTCELRRRRSLLDPFPDSHREWLEELRDQLLCVKQHAPAQTPSALLNQLSGHAGVNISSGEWSVEKTAEAFRLAALILWEDTYYYHSDLYESRTADYISQMFQLLESGAYIPPCGKLGSSSYLWPYFIAGCYLRCPQQQTAMLNYITRLTPGDDLDTWPRNTMAEKIQEVLVHVWALMSGYSSTTFILEMNGSSNFLWETALTLSNCVFEWV